MFGLELSLQTSSPNGPVSTIGWYYYENDKRVLHCQTPLLEIHKGRIARLDVSKSTPLSNLKKIIVVLQKAGKLRIPSAIMLKMQAVYGECFKESVLSPGNCDAVKMREALLSRIVSLMKCKGKLPKEETAIFGEGQREKFLWFISAAKIERESSKDADSEDKSPEADELYPILFCETKEVEMISQREAAARISQGIRYFLARHARGDEGDL